ncbi:MAG: hypothetical protein ACOCV1_08750 [Bacillota bacterium]
MDLKKIAVIISAISAAISAGALGFSIYATFKANKYKDIEKRVNELEIEEKIEKKQNKLKANIKLIYLGDYWFEIINTGNVIAKNIDIADINIDKSNIVYYKWFPLKTLKPNKNKRFSIKNINDLKTIKIKLSWEDEYGEKFNKPRKYKNEFEL